MRGWSKPRRGDITSKNVIFIPTYNERENAGEMYRQLKALGLDADILFLDDNSPDGTGQLLDDLAAKDPHLHIIHRPGRLGIGSAHLDGIAWAYDHGAERLVTMDCDFTHSPSDVPVLLAEADRADVVVGSRWLRPDSLPGWNWVRRIITRGGHFLTRRFMGMSQDASGALRAYNLKKIPRSLFACVRSHGYSFFAESLFVLTFNKFSVHEVGIVLPARTYGHSKMSMREALRSARRIMWFGCQARLNPRRFRFIEPFADINPALGDSRAWDDYWETKTRTTNFVYDTLAGVYRRLVIRRRLNKEIRRNFAPGSRLLHAGCGSGQVDSDLQKEMQLTAIDISPAALALYRSNNPQAHELRHASIFNLPFEDGHFDGAYNLGVIEHFSEDEIRRILAEMRRVVKPGGKVVLFWPHARASSVKVLGAAHWMLNNVLKRNIHFHPPETSLLKSREWAEALLRDAKLEMVDYYFGAKDFYVQAAIVARKA